MKKTSSDSSRSTSLINNGSNRGGNAKQRQGQSSRRVLKMLVAVVVAFFVCWAPFHTQRLVAIYGTIPADHEDRQKFTQIYDIVTYVSGVLYYFSTTVNPFLYNIMSNKFRDAFKETFSRCCGLSCIHTQQPQRAYSILARSNRRGAESHTDSSGRDDPSVQTHVTLTHKNSQESMNLHGSTYRYSIKSKSDGTEMTNRYYIQGVRKNDKQDGDTFQTNQKLLGMSLNRNIQKRTFNVWNYIVKTRGPNEQQSKEKNVSYATANVISNIENEKDAKVSNISTSSCDISNSSLKDIDNALLEDELENYLRTVK